MSVFTVLRGGGGGGGGGGGERGKGREEGREKSLGLLVAIKRTKHFMAHLSIAHPTL